MVRGLERFQPRSSLVSTRGACVPKSWRGKGIPRKKKTQNSVRGHTRGGRHRKSQCCFRVEVGVTVLQQGAHFYTTAPPLDSAGFWIGSRLTHSPHPIPSTLSSAHKHSASKCLLPSSAVVFQETCKSTRQSCCFACFSCFFCKRAPIPRPCPSSRN